MSDYSNTPEFKRKAVELYRSKGTSYAAVARELGCDPKSLSNRVKAADGSGCGPDNKPFQTAEDLGRLKREDGTLLTESAFFASRQL